MFSLLRFGGEYKVYHLLMPALLIWRPGTVSKNVLSQFSVGEKKKKKSQSMPDFERLDAESFFFFFFLS